MGKKRDKKRDKGNGEMGKWGHTRACPHFNFSCLISYLPTKSGGHGPLARTGLASGTNAGFYSTFNAGQFIVFQVCYGFLV